RSARMLGHHGPGSEGNLASDFENKDDAVTPPEGNAPQESPKPEGKPESPRGKAKTEKVTAEKAAAESKAAAEPKPAVEAIPPAEAQVVPNGDPPIAPAEMPPAESKK